MASSKYFLRCYNETEYGEFVLTVHKGRVGYVYHFVSNEIVHILNYIDKEQLVQEITGFFHPLFNKDNEHMEFTLPEIRFQQFMEELQKKSVACDNIERMTWLKEDRQKVEKFIEDYQFNNGKIVNLSLIFTEEEALPTFSEVYLLLLAEGRIWTIHNINKNKEQEPILKIQTINEKEWANMVNSLIVSVKEN